MLSVAEESPAPTRYRLGHTREVEDKLDSSSWDILTEEDKAAREEDNCDLCSPSLATAEGEPCWGEPRTPAA
ncbi:hypothetical protein Pmani_031872 [Petrolisthes manimaculis]|uniref:Uncharacterized protein n=1 Tax=Petrolisthes manimaculis TaxID=1843537 RepID=A0AAE1NUI3_9EUCA|nr:hypothetical protein Pmani_031872 [Petrolisthes manimaculis]